MKGKGFALGLVAAVFLAVPTIAESQGDGGRRGQRSARIAGGMFGGSSIDFLLSQDSLLNFSEEQKKKIKQLKSELMKMDKPLRDSMQALRPRGRRGGGDDGGLDTATIRKQMETMRRLREKMQKNDKKALEKMLKMLDEKQAPVAKKLIDMREKRMEEMRKMRMQRGNRGGRGGGTGGGGSSGGGGSGPR